MCDVQRGWSGRDTDVNPFGVEVACAWTRPPVTAQRPRPQKRRCASHTSTPEAQLHPTHTDTPTVTQHKRRVAQRAVCHVSVSHMLGAAFSQKQPPTSRPTSLDVCCAVHRCTVTGRWPALALPFLRLRSCSGLRCPFPQFVDSLLLFFPPSNVFLLFALFNFRPALQALLNAAKLPRHLP